jgi:hypothetical protein
MEGMVSSTPLPLYPSRNRHRYPLIAGWVGSRASMDAMKKNKNIAAVKNRTQAVHPTACRYTDWAIPAPYRPEDETLYSLLRVYVHAMKILTKFPSAYSEYQLLNQTATATALLLLHDHVLKDSLDSYRRDVSTVCWQRFVSFYKCMRKGKNIISRSALIN